MGMSSEKVDPKPEDNPAMLRLIQNLSAEIADTEREEKGLNIKLVEVRGWLTSHRSALATVKALLK